MCWKVVNVSKNGLLDLGKFFSTTREIFVYKIKKFVLVKEIDRSLRSL